MAITGQVSLRLKHVNELRRASTMSFYWLTETPHSLSQPELCRNLWDTIDYWSFWTVSLLANWDIGQWFSWAMLGDEKGTLVESVKLDRQQWSGQNPDFRWVTATGMIQGRIRWAMGGWPHMGYTQFPSLNSEDLESNFWSFSTVLLLGIFAEFHVQDRAGAGGILWRPSIPCSDGVWRPITSYQVDRYVSRQLHRRTRW